MASECCRWPPGWLAGSGVRDPHGARFLDLAALEHLTGQPVRAEYRMPGDSSTLPPDGGELAPPQSHPVGKGWIYQSGSEARGGRDASQSSIRELRRTAARKVVVGGIAQVRHLRRSWAVGSR